MIRPALLDVTYEHEGQIVTTSNIGPDKLAEKWGGMQAQVALRRIAGEGGHAFKFK